MMNRQTLKVALLLCGSGACALIYQVVWLRELRLVFGASTAATSTVLGIFMGGLGLGGAVLGRRVDRNPRPLNFYSNLELCIAGLAAVTPLVIVGARAAYLASGGLVSLGLVGATLLRLLLSVIVLGLPTFLMGGTLPAAVRTAETEDDLARRNLAVLYGANTFGAVVGAFVATFWMLEVFGTRNTLWLACAVNALIAMKARDMSRSLPAVSIEAGDSPAAEDSGDDTAHVPANFVYVAAAVVGFAFLLMELVWYRMLGAILGGTTYTFGLILVMALFGIGVGGALYSFGRGAIRPSVTMFTVTCALEALVIGLPFAFGDRIAEIAGLLQVFSVFGFPMLVLSWMMVASVVIFPSALVAGYQFPLLIGLLGPGRKDVGRHVGTAYAWNTLGAIVGSIAGGFLLLPLLTAPGCWRLVVGLLVVLSFLGAIVAARGGAGTGSLVATAILCVVSFATVSFDGPTAVWRHSGIGARRAHINGLDGLGLQRWEHSMRRNLVWEAEGLEMSVGLNSMNGLSFIVNGKNDGNARGDASTQVGSGLISAALHPAPRHALVIGLGTGSTAGWLGRIPSIERVDAVELEPAILEVARRCNAVNAGVLTNPNVRVLLADGREVLLANRQEYDLIVSEPSNPYRAGIASLYTTEFYRAVADRLRPGGLFTQWVQAYEIDSRTVRTIVATLATVFPYVQVWQTNGVDMMFVCSVTDPGPVRIDLLRSRLAERPFREAFSAVWGTTDAEGFLSHFVAESRFSEVVAADVNRINSDDRMLVEFGFARAVGRRVGFSIEDLRASAIEHRLHRPAIVGGEIEWEAVEAGRVMMHAVLHRGVPDNLRSMSPSTANWQAYDAFLMNDFEEVRRLWEAGDVRIRFAFDIAVIATALAEASDPAALQWIGRMEPVWRLESEVIAARFLWRTGEVSSAVDGLEEVFTEVRTNPWIHPLFLEAALDLARDLGSQHPEFARQLFDVLQPEFAVAMENEVRLQTLLSLASKLGPLATAEIMHGLEPDVPWEHSVLVRRFDAYEAIGDPRTERARRDLVRLVSQLPEEFRNP